MSLTLFDTVSPLGLFGHGAWHRQGGPLAALVGGWPVAAVGRGGGRVRADRFGAVDVTETETEVRLAMDLPGLTEQDVSIELQDTDLLVISAERRSGGHGGLGAEPQAGFYERSCGSVTRSIRLGDGALTEQLQASLQDGVLQVTVPKAEPQPPATRRIQIAAAHPHRSQATPSTPPAGMAQRDAAEHAEVMDAVA